MSGRDRIDLLELMRGIRRSAADQRKIFLTVYGLLLFVALALVVVALGRTAISGEFGAELRTTFLRPALGTSGFFSAAFSEGRWALMAGVLLGVGAVASLVGSVFGLAVTRMAAIELTCDRRAEISEALRFTRGHWYWAFLTPACLVAGALLLLGLAALLLSLGRVSEYFLVVAAPAALILAGAAIVLVLGLVAGGMLAAPTIATEWSDAFDAVTRVYGYSFAHAHRVMLYRTGGAVMLGLAAATRGFRALLVLGAFHLALLAGLGGARTKELFLSALLEPPGALPFPATVASWVLVACVAILLTLLVARLLVFRLVLIQGIYLLLRLRIDKVPLQNIDGYRPDDSAYDPTAQGFELVEIEEEIPAE